jgi:hypothetical protein
MGVLGTALALFGLWSIAALGVFAAFAGLSGLRGRDSMPLVPMVAQSEGWKRPVIFVADATLVVAGIGAAVAAVFGVLAVVYM